MGSFGGFQGIWLQSGSTEYMASTSQHGQHGLKAWLRSSWGSNGLLGGQQPCWSRLLSSSQHPAWMEEPVCRTSRFNAYMDASKSKQASETDNWEMLSCENSMSFSKILSDDGPVVEDFISILQKCRKKKDIACARRLHTHICTHGLESHTTLGNYLVPMLVECGSVPDAQQVFHKLSDQNEFSWTSLMQGYMESGEYQHAFDLFQKMQEICVRSSSFTFQVLLKACARLKSVKRGHLIHMEIAKESLDGDSSVGNTLVDMYAKCGSFADAQGVFDKLLVRDVVSWTALIAGYAEHEHSNEAWHCWEQMQLQGVSPNRVTFAATLAICGSIGALDRGQEIHAVVGKEGFEQDSFVGNTLVDMYGKCGSLEEAREVFDELLVRDVISWTALITGYAKHGLVKEAWECLEQMQREGVSPNLVSWNTLIAEYAEHGCGEEALDCLEKMQEEGMHPDAITLTCGVKACGRLRCIGKGRFIHTEITKEGYERDPFVGNTLVDMYCKCGSLIEAREIFDKLQARDVVSWTALISGYAEHGLGEEALSCLEEMRVEGFPITAITWNALIATYAELGLGEEALKCLEKMQLEGVHPNVVTYTCSLKSCARIGAIIKAREIHAEVAKEGLEKDPFVGSSLVDMYAKCGTLAEADEVFQQLPVRDAVSWSMLIAAYAEHGLADVVLNCLQKMQLEGMSPNAITFIHCLKACDSIGDLSMGQNMHAQILSQGLERDLSVGNVLIAMYSKYSLFLDAQDVFNRLPVRNVASWNALIAGYAEQGFGNEALECLRKMQLNGVFPDAMTYLCSLKGGYSIGAIARGLEVHAEIVKDGLERKPSTGSALVDLYAKCGSFAEAQEVLDELPVRDEVSWTALIAGYAQHRLGNEALKCFERMQLEGLCPKHDTFVWSLKACGNIGAVGQGRELHCDILKWGLERDSFVGNTMVDMYAKCGSFLEARAVFDELPVRNVVSWNTFIMGCAENGLGEEVLNCSKRMQVEGVSMDAITLVGILKACSSLGAIVRGQEIHTEAAKEGFERDFAVSSTLVDMYAKCGLLREAWEVFEQLPAQDVILWTALITGYACQGECKVVFGLFEKMKEKCIAPDGITFLSVLTVCCHAGLVDKGQKYFEAISKENGIIPSHEHYNCLVDLLARAGQLNKAAATLESMPLQPNLMMWITMLGACRKWGNVDLGRHAFDCAVELVEKQAAPFILMLNLYAHAFMWEDANKFEAVRVNTQAWKQLEESWVDVGGIQSFELLHASEICA